MLGAQTHAGGAQRGYAVTRDQSMARLGMKWPAALWPTVGCAALAVLDEKMSAA